jgi:transcriptional regulator with XRE-family HTH domain
MAIGPDGGTEIGSRIRGARTAKGWSQKRLAETLGVTQATVSHWEKSFTPPIAQTIAQIAEALEIEAGELLGDLADDRAIAPRPTGNGLRRAWPASSRCFGNERGPGKRSPAPWKSRRVRG